MTTVPVYRTIERSSPLFGLEPFDALLWALTFYLLDVSVILGVSVIALTWVGLFSLRFRKPPRFLQSYLRYHCLQWWCGNRYSAALREKPQRPWLSLRRGAP